MGFFEDWRLKKSRRLEEQSRRLEEQQLKEYRDFDQSCGQPTIDTLKKRICKALTQPTVPHWSVVMDCLDKGLPGSIIMEGPAGYTNLLSHILRTNNFPLLQEIITRQNGKTFREITAEQKKDALTIAQTNGNAKAAKLLYEAINGTTPQQPAIETLTPADATIQIEDLARRFPAEFSAVAARIEEAKTLDANVPVKVKLTLKTPAQAA